MKDWIDDRTGNLVDHWSDRSSPFCRPYVGAVVGFRKGGAVGRSPRVLVDQFCRRSTDVGLCLLASRSGVRGGPVEWLAGLHSKSGSLET